MKALGSVGGKITVKNLAKLNAVKFEALTSAGAVLLPTIPYEFETISLPVLSEVGGDIQFIANTDDTAIGGMTVSYTHLDVYKRQLQGRSDVHAVEHSAVAAADAPDVAQQKYRKHLLDVLFAAAPVEAGTAFGELRGDFCQRLRRGGSVFYQHSEKT